MRQEDQFKYVVRYRRISSSYQDTMYRSFRTHDELTEWLDKKLKQYHGNFKYAIYTYESGCTAPRSMVLP